MANHIPNIDRFVGARIRRARMLKRITQDELAELVGMDNAHLFRLERGDHSMKLQTLKRIADALGVKVKTLIGDI